LTCEPYKSEICAYWRFRTPEIARESARKIEEMFNGYLDAMDDAKVIKKDAEYEQGNVEWQRAFVGADMSRKFIQMGMTRAKRYANHASGKKYAADGTIIPIVKLDEEKLAASEIFKEVWNRVRLDPRYVEAKEEWGRLVKVWDKEAKKNLWKMKQEDTAPEDGSPETSTRRTRSASQAIKKEIKEEDQENVLWRSSRIL
jgi:hypothetical protein